MKEKTKKALTHDIELIGKRVPVLAVAALLLVAAGSAALLNNFGEITGEAEVDQAVYLDAEDQEATIDEGVLTASYQTDFVAGQTFNDQFTAVNDADSEVEVEFTRTGEDSNLVGTDPDEEIVQELYEVQEYELVGQTYEDTEEYDTDYGVEVAPGVDEVTYRVDFPDEASEVDVEVSLEEGDNYHIKYATENVYDDEDNLLYEKGWNYKDPSLSGETEGVDDFELFREGEVEDDAVEFTVEREHEQSFSVHLMGEFDDFDSAVTPTAHEEDDGSGSYFYDDEETDHHEDVDYTGQIGESFTLDEETEYTLGTYFPINTAPSEDGYDFGVELDLAAE